MRKFLMIFCSIFFSLSATAQQVPFELKGLRIGMPSAEAKALFPTSMCPPIGGAMVCSVGTVSFGDATSARLSYVLLDNNVIDIYISLNETEFNGVVDALKSKFGMPSREENSIIQNRMGAKFENVTLSWTNGDISLTAERRNTSVDKSKVDMFSKSALVEWNRRRKESSSASANKL